MTVTTSIEIDYKFADGWHIFQSKQMPGLYVANCDPRQAYEAVCPAVEELIRLDSKLDCKAVPSVAFPEFIGPVRADMTSYANLQRITVFKDAA